MKAIAEAPGKVIITGEHFVVHGAWALAAAISRKVRAEASPSDSLTVSSARFPRASPALRPAVAVVGHLARKHDFRPRLSIRVSSDIPEGSGLGSSAATTVAVAAAVSRLNGLRLPLTELIEASMEGEKLVHGRPSGIDSNICARGGVILFRPGSRPRRVAPAPGTRLIVSHSGTVRSTARLVGKVSSSRSKSPEFFDGLARTVSGVSLLASQRLTSGDRVGLGLLLSFNHKVLSAVGASTPALDRLVSRSLSLGALGAKLTGAGGGGCVLSVAPEGKEKRIISGLGARGNETFVTQIPVGGVRSWLSR